MLVLDHGIVCPKQMAFRSHGSGQEYEGPGSYVEFIWVSAL